MAQDFAYANGHAHGHTHHASVAENAYTRPKKLIVCCDGTWQDSDNGWVKGSWGKRGHPSNPTNVTRIARAISSEDGDHHAQIVYYQAGVGTGIGITSQILGGGTGLGLAENIREAYAFLVSNYRERDPDRLIHDDSIFLIGFSRGAYTARSIGGLIGAVGVLKKRAMAHFYEVFSDWMNAGNKDYTPLFFNSYAEHHHDVDVESHKPPLSLARDNTKIDEYMLNYLKALLALDLTQEAHIKCIGVWDTVGALGIPINPILQRAFPFLPSFVREYSWFDTRLDDHMDNAFQALALDEHRFPFSPTLWEKREGGRTNLKQVWFPGVHSNIGGSYSDAGMADITLAWMMDQLAGNTTKHPDGIKHHLDWIKFDENYIEYWQDCELDWYETHKKDEYKGWGMGYLYESCYFPQSLIGTRVRGPGRYHRTFYETGKPDMSRPLVNTNESIHSCVRARIDLAGRAVEPDWSQVFPSGVAIGPLIVHCFRWLFGKAHRPYQPQRKGGPLHGWRLEDGHDSHFDPNMDIDMSPVGMKEIKWVYEGKDKIPTKVMLEDKLGDFEYRLLKKDQQLANQIMYSNNNWHFFKKHPKGSPKPAHTM